MSQSKRKTSEDKLILKKHPTPKADGGKAAAESFEPVSRQVAERIRLLRNDQGWTLEQLASLSGVSRSMLSQIERERVNPTLGVVYRVAHAFGISLAELTEGSSEHARIEVIRGNDPEYLFRDDGELRIRTLSPLSRAKDVEFYEMVLQPGGNLHSGPHFHGTREFLTVQKGMVLVRSGDLEVELGEGDSAEYPADVQHSIKQSGRGPVVAVLVVIYPRGK